MTAWKSKDLSNESIKPPNTNLNPAIYYNNSDKIRVKCNRNTKLFKARQSNFYSYSIIIFLDCL